MKSRSNRGEIYCDQICHGLESFVEIYFGTPMQINGDKRESSSHLVNEGPRNTFKHRVPQDRRSLS